VSTVVKLTILRGDSKELKEISITRDVINVPAIKTTLRSDGVFVVSFYSFSGLSSQQFRDAMRKFVQSGYSRMIIDLRGNPGGYLEAAVDTASYFLPVGYSVVSEDSGNANPVVHHSKGYDIFARGRDLKLVVLIDGGSASASEILAGALHDHGVATLIGKKSFGKGSVQELVDLGGGASLKVTIAKWLTPKGTSISQQGIVPDIEVDRTIDDVKAGKDPQMDAAVQYLRTH
jgi:carboxyl-terminal processing protease